MAAFDLVVLDNVYEHLPDHGLALERIAAALRPGGVASASAPNKAWPIEAHYKLPFLCRGCRCAGLIATWRWSRRGTSYEDASQRSRPTGRCGATSADSPTSPRTSSCRTTPPRPWRAPLFDYRWGMAALRPRPALWAISKALLVVLVKEPADSPADAARLIR